MCLLAWIDDAFYIDDTGSLRGVARRTFLWGLSGHHRWPPLHSSIQHILTLSLFDPAMLRHRMTRLRLHH